MLTPSSLSSLHPLVTTPWQLITVAELSNQMRKFSLNQFTGRLDVNVENNSEQQWSLYFSLGSLIWATGGTHPMRLWYRQLVRHCPQLFISQKAHLNHCPDYDLLGQICRQGKIQKHEMDAVIEGQILEILFDIIQSGETLNYTFGGQLTYRAITVDTINSKLYMMSTDHALFEGHQLWDAWQRAGLAKYSPNLAPVISQAAKLQEQTSELVYRNLTTNVDGNQTLRDLAVKMNRNLLLLIKSIKLYIEQGLIGLIQVEDIRCSIETVNVANQSFIRNRQVESTATNFVPTSSPQTANNLPFPTPKQSTSKTNNSLIACIDDSKIDSLRMSKILSELDYSCISIQDPVQALPILLEHKPDLIFLDLVMPIANGYEICTQIRRVSMFKNTPIIILTSNDGIVDRMRAKMVGASSFLAKPINSEKLMTTIQKYLIVSAPTRQAPISTNFERNLEHHRFG